MNKIDLNAKEMSCINFFAESVAACPQKTADLAKQVNEKIDAGRVQPLFDLLQSMPIYHSVGQLLATIPNKQDAFVSCFCNALRHAHERRVSKSKL